jgi:hypothetical protein
MPVPDIFRALARTSLITLALTSGAALAWSQTPSKAAPRPPPAPDPALFDGTDFPPEERPERGLFADFEAGEEEAKAGGDPDKQESGGGGEQQEGGGTGLLAGAGGGREGEGAGADEAGSSGDAPEGANGSAGPEAGQAPKVAAADDQALVKPGDMPLGDPNARIAQTPEALRAPPPGSKASNQQGEDRMSVKAASGQQAPNRSRGSERGIEIPSSL